MKRPTKKQIVDKHFARRCIERIGYVPDSKDLVNKIQAHKLEYYDKQSYRLSRWKWLEPIKNIPCILVYDKIRKQIVTILFQDKSMLYA